MVESFNYYLNKCSHRVTTNTLEGINHVRFSLRCLYLHISVTVIEITVQL